MTLKGPKFKFLLGFISGNLFLFFVLALILIITVQYTKKSPAEIAETLRVPPIPSALDADYDLPLKTLDGAPFDFSSLRGRPVFLTFFNPDCKSCQGELAAIEGLYKITGSEAEFVLVTRSGTPEEIQQTIGKFNVTAPIYILDAKEKPAAYYAPTVPATFILSRNGKIAFKHVGTAKWDDDIVVKFLLSLAASPEAGTGK